MEAEPKCVAGHEPVLLNFKRVIKKGDLEHFKSVCLSYGMMGHVAVQIAHKGTM